MIVFLGESGYAFIAKERPAIRSYEYSPSTTHASASAFIPLLSGLVGKDRTFIKGSLFLGYELNCLPKSLLIFLLTAHLDSLCDDIAKIVGSISHLYIKINGIEIWF